MFFNEIHGRFPASFASYQIKKNKKRKDFPSDNLVSTDVFVPDCLLCHPCCSNRSIMASETQFRGEITLKIQRYLTLEHVQLFSHEVMIGNQVSNHDCRWIWILSCNDLYFNRRWKAVHLWLHNCQDPNKTKTILNSRNCNPGFYQKSWTISQLKHSQHLFSSFLHKSRNQIEVRHKFSPIATWTSHLHFILYHALKESLLELKS